MDSAITASIACPITAALDVMAEKRRQLLVAIGTKEEPAAKGALLAATREVNRLLEAHKPDVPGIRRGDVVMQEGSGVPDNWGYTSARFLKVE